VTREKLVDELSELAVVGDSGSLPCSENRHFRVVGAAEPFRRWIAGKEDLRRVLGR
jgi:hypothetical protein